MSSGIAQKADLAAGVGQVLYTVDLGVFTGNIRLTNRNSTPVKVRIAITGSSTAPSESEWIEYDAVIPGNEPLEDTAIIMVAGEKIYVYSDTANVSARVHGIQEVF